MKVSGNGQAKILNPAELATLFKELQRNPRNACLFAICLFTGCRISEALKLQTTDIVENFIIFRKSNTKGKLKTRTVPINPALRRYLTAYEPKKPGYLFPGMIDSTTPHLSRNSADRIFKSACKRCGIVGASTHSFRRTALTNMSRAGIPLRNIQAISGHGDLGVLQAYLEVDENELITAVDKIWF